MTKKITTAIIAAAGQATRMWPASKVTAKELFPIGKIPAIAHLVLELVDAGIKDVVIVASARNKDFMCELFDTSIAAPSKFANDPLVRRFQDGLSRCSISIIQQTGGYGNGTPLRLAAERFGTRPCVYAFGDDIVIGENATQGLLGIYQRTGHPVMGAQAVSPARRSSFGILEFKRHDGIDYIVRILEKPSPGKTSSNLASFGRYVVTSAVLEKLSQTEPGRDGEIWFTDAMLAHLRTGGQSCLFRLTKGTWYTVGDPKSYAEAVRAATDEQLNAAHTNL